MSDAAAPGFGALPARNPYLGIARPLRHETTLDRAVARVVGRAQPALAPLRRAALARIVPAVARAEAEFGALDDAGLLSAARGVARDSRRLRDPADPVFSARAFALVRLAAARHLGLRHHPVQLMGGQALMRGWLAEMATGEGKTLTATLAAAALAMTGRPVHVITVNDYLARRDAEEMGPVYAALGLSVASVVQGLPPDARRAAYRADITYCTNKELTFDYLRDQVSAPLLPPLAARMRTLSPDAQGLPPLLRGLAAAIVDEADSVLVDEARTPLILSGDGPALFDEALLRMADALAAALKPGRDWTAISSQRRVEMTGRGSARLDRAAPEGPLANRVLREDLVCKALTARHMLRRDADYLVTDDGVCIVDEHTGRVMPDRFWTEGLQQLVEVKEGLPLSRGRRTLAQTTYQRFFRRYDRLSGMTGTAREVAAELHAVYRLPVVPIPPHRPVRRRVLPTRVLGGEAAKWQAIAQRAEALHADGLPVLVGTRTVAASARAAAALASRGVPHQVLSAAQDADEAAKIGHAGAPGAVTVATNMAGRGADIPLGPGVEARGGLQVILSERHDSARVDRQLAGRAGRQGAPGTVQAIVAADDPILAFSPVARLLARIPLSPVRRLAQRLAQRRAEKLYARMRRDMLYHDGNMSDAMAFAGAPD